MIKICFEVQEIDYEKSFESLIPQLTEACKANAEPTEIEKLIVRLGDDTVPLVEKLLGFLDTDARDQIIVWRLEDVADEMVAIKELRDRLIDKHISEHAQVSINKLYREINAEYRAPFVR